MSEGDIDVSGIAPEALLAALYNEARPKGLGFIHFTPVPMTPTEAAALIAERGGLPVRFDYLKGRVMKLTIDGKTLFPRLYDRDNGEGMAANVVEALRLESPTADARARGE